MIRLDTHAVVWLHTGEVERFTTAGQRALENQPLIVSPMVRLELTYLHEIGRLTISGADILADLAVRIGLTISDQPFDAVVLAATASNWTRDPFDRLIVGDALASNSPLLTKDELIRQHCSLARW